MDRVALLSMLEANEFESLVGQFENEWLECKSQPYDLTREDQKLELAKDVSGLANAVGGVLLIGYATKRSELHGEDQISDVRGFPRDMFNPAQYKSIISSWTYPAIEDIDIRIYSMTENANSIIACISVGVIPESQGPVLVSKVMLENGRKTELVFGYFTRKRFHVAHYDVRKLHSLLRDGQRYDTRIRDDLAALHDAIASLRTAQVAIPNSLSSDEVRHSVKNALEHVGLSEKPAMMLTAVPSPTLNLKGLFESSKSELVRLLEHPPEIRSSGFNLYTGQRSKIVSGNLRRTFEAGDRLLELHRDGRAIFVCNGGENGLCWGRANKQRHARLINQVALIETVYLFCLFWNSAFELATSRPESVHLTLELSHLRQGEHFTKLEPGRLEQMNFGIPAKPAIDENASVHVTVPYGCAPEHAAYLILAEIYIWFGFETDRIPYVVTNSVNEKSIDPDSLMLR